MTYARARLWLGISGVGFFVLLAAGALWFNLAARLLAGDTRAIALTLLAYLVLSLPADVLGGYLLPRRYGRSDPSLARFLAAWLRGAVLQAAVMFACAFLILKAAQAGGTLAGLAVFFALMLCLIQGQLLIATLVGGLKRLTDPAQTEPGTYVYRSTDPAFVGGLVGLPGSETLVLPSAWLDTLPPAVVEMQRTRRLGALTTGARTRGVGLALVWNFAGFAVASQLPDAGLASAPALVATALWFTLWSFVGLLLLPSLNRPGVFEADRFALAAGIPPAALEEGMTTLDRLQDDEPERSRWIERVFHPIPSVQSRVRALAAPPSGTPGAWQGARVTLYLSWAGLSLLSRAVHCNVGRPELWVLFPGD